MICKQCGLEYPDDLQACPGCHAPNEDVEAQPMSQSERDDFDGVTIETPSDNGPDENYKVYDRQDVEREQENEAKRQKRQALWTMAKSNVKAVLVIAAVLVLLALALPTLITFFFMIFGVYCVYALVNYFFRQ